MRRIRKYLQIRNVNGCAACGERFTDNRPSKQFTALQGTQIAVHADCIPDLKFTQGVLRTNWQAIRERRRDAVESGPHSDDDILGRVFAQNPDVERACDERAERRIAAFLGKSKTALQHIEMKQDIGAFSENRMFVPPDSISAQNVTIAEVAS